MLDKYLWQERREHSSSMQSSEQYAHRPDSRPWEPLAPDYRVGAMITRGDPAFPQRMEVSGSGL